MKNKENSIIDFQPYFNSYINQIYSLKKKIDHHYDFSLFFKRTSIFCPYGRKSKPFKCLFYGHKALCLGSIWESPPQIGHPPDFWTAGRATIYGPCDYCGKQIFIKLISHQEILDCIDNKADIVAFRNQYFRKEKQKQNIVILMHKVAKYRQLARINKEYKLADYFRSILDQYNYTIEEYKNGTYKLERKSQISLFKIV